MSQKQPRFTFFYSTGTKTPGPQQGQEQGQEQGCGQAGMEGTQTR